MSLSMYCIVEVQFQYAVTCTKCASNEYVDPSCCKCGGKGIHYKTVNLWGVDDKLEEIVNITDGGLFYGNVEVKYYTNQSDYYSSFDQKLFYTLKGALEKCKFLNNENGLKQLILKLKPTVKGVSIPAF